MNIDPDTLLVTMTYGQLVASLKEALGVAEPERCQADLTPHGRNLLYGLDGISRFLGVSKTTIGQYKAKGVINRSIVLWGHRKVVVDSDILLEEIKEYNDTRFSKNG